jgi:Na+:H+ antiporter, NhaA family
MQHHHEHAEIIKGRLPSRLRAFMAMEAAGGIVMLCSALMALIVANSPLDALYTKFIDFPIHIRITESLYTIAVDHLVNDVLMIGFFFIVGLELKREMSEGFLTRRDQITLPLIAAAAGMAVPALIYAMININSPLTLHGWAIPSATDIAFAVTILSLAGRGMPPSLKIFLLAVAIFDDIGAIIIIASFYNSGISLLPLLYIITITATLFLLSRCKISSIFIYLLLGSALAISLHHCGIHTTLAGVITGLAIPMRDKNDQRYSPVNRCIHKLHPWVNFGVLPLFAFCSSGIDLRHINLTMLHSPIPLGILCGLFFGKQIGIFASVWALVSSKRFAMPQNANWFQIYAVSVLTGIGFTMSLFIGILAFESKEHIELVKLGVIMGTSLSIIWGIIILRIARKQQRAH